MKPRVKGGRRKERGRADVRRRDFGFLDPSLLPVLDLQTCRFVHQSVSYENVVASFFPRSPEPRNPKKRRPNPSSRESLLTSSPPPSSSSSGPTEQASSQRGSQQRCLRWQLRCTLIVRWPASKRRRACQPLLSSIPPSSSNASRLFLVCFYGKGET